MSLLSISLGTYTPLEGSMSAKSLPEAKSLSSPSPSSISSLKLHVLAGDLSSVWGNPMDLSVFTESLQPDATVTVSVKLTSPEGFDPSVLRSIHTSFLLAGLVGTSEKKEGDGSRVLTARKIPKESIPGAAPLKNKKLNFNNVISLNLNDDSDLINEDNLLSDASNLLGVPPSMSAVATKDDCAGREPCENCSCGRADNQNGTANGGMKKENKAVDASACGKCGLGDAFRCASCPYLGKPAFKAGQEHLILDLQDDL